MRSESVTQVIRRFLIFEGATFVAAALVHFGSVVDGYEHRQAGVAESVIAVALLAGWIATWIGPARTRRIGLAAQAFALLGTLVGVFTIIVGVGPRTVPDIAYHVAIVAVLVWGLIVAKRAPAEDAGRRA
jgi:hypothetical protein